MLNRRRATLRAAFFNRLNPRSSIMRLASYLAVLICLPSLSYAVSSDDSTPPKPTQTASDCEKGEVFDEKTQTCLDAKSGLINDDTRYEAVRELAYAGQYDRARLILNTMSDQSEARVLTYRGFIARKTGDNAAAFELYAQALAADADNILARSYLGMAYVETGDLANARIQLSEIRTRGGRNTWAEFALRSALETGVTKAY
jgi:tetratricopeptide (TPR) repeat protein